MICKNINLLNSLILYKTTIRLSNSLLKISNNGGGLAIKAFSTAFEPRK